MTDKNNASSGTGRSSPSGEGRRTVATDEEIIAAFMEPKPEINEYHRDGSRYWSPNGWWTLKPNASDWTGRQYDLDQLHLVEERLTEEQQGAYADLISSGSGDSLLEESWALLHATAEQKIRALAATIRGSEARAKGDGE